MKKNKDLDLARSNISSGNYVRASELLLPISRSTIKGARGEALFLLGCIAGLTGSPALAGERFKEALKLFPSNTTIRFNFAKALEDQRLFDEAIRQYELIIRDDPLSNAAKLNLANCLLSSQRFSDAKGLYQQILDGNAQDTAALTGLGCCLVEEGDAQGGLMLHNEALRLDGSLVAAWSNRALALKKLGQASDCIDSHKNAVELSPFNGNLRLNLFSSLTFFGRFVEALDCVEQISRLGLTVSRPTAEMQAEVYRGRGCLSTAQSILEPLVRSASPAASSLNLYGMILKDLGKLSEAKQVFERVLAIDPGNEASKFNLSLVLLELREFERGWIEYRSRWGTANFPSSKFYTSKRPNEGETRGRLLVCGEQGVGEQLMFLHGLEYAKGLSPSVLASIDKRLIPLAELVSPGIDFLPMDEKIGEDRYDEFVYAGDIFGAWHSRRLSNFDGLRPVNFARPSPVPVRDGRLLIGLSWRSKNRQFGEFKSPNLKSFQCLQNISDSIRWVNLQYAWELDELELFGRMGLTMETREGLNLLDDFVGLCDLINECDVVVTVSNSTAHLCGLLGKKAIVITPTQNGRLWFWHSVGSRSYWYPSIEVVRCQSTWADCLGSVEKRLRELYPVL